MKPEQLAARERRAYDGLKGDPEAASRYLTTRDYLRTCRKVVARTLPALDLPDIPEDFDDAYISETEEKLIDKAVNMNLAAIVLPGARD